MFFKDARPKRKMLQDKIYYIHFRNRDPFTGTAHCKGGITIAMILGTENVIEYGVAICNVSDNFCRKTGRKLAEQRLKAELADSVEANSGFSGQIYDTEAILKKSELSAVEDFADEILMDFPQLPSLIETSQEKYFYNLSP